MHARDEVHDTPSSTLAGERAGFGVAWITQALPFHASASVTVVSAELT